MKMMISVQLFLKLTNKNNLFTNFLNVSDKEEKCVNIFNEIKYEKMKVQFKIRRKFTQVKSPQFHTFRKR